MHDLNLNLFYRTAFDITGVNENVNLLKSVVNSIRYWLTSKWNKDEIVVPEDRETWDRLSRKFSFTSIDSDKSVRLSSHIYWEGHRFRPKRGYEKGFSR